MDQLEIYLLLFTDSLVCNLAFNNSVEIAIYSMKIFGLYNPFIIVIIAGLAFCIASCINYFIGRLCYKILSPWSEEKDNHNDNGQKLIIQLQKFKYLPFILLLSAIPFFGKFIVLFAGFCNIRFLKAIIIAVIAKLIYYSYLMS